MPAPKLGSVWEGGPVGWCDGHDADFLPTGNYPLAKDGTLDGSVRQRWVDDAPDDPNSNAGHFEVMRKDTGYAHAGRIVPLKAHVKGSAKTGVGK
jgi:hypothetical protein